MSLIQAKIKNHSEYKDAIIRTIETRQGINSTELILNVMGMINPTHFDEEIYLAELAKIVDMGQVVEIQYILPDIPTLKSIYFPKGTKFVR